MYLSELNLVANRSHPVWRHAVLLTGVSLACLFAGDQVWAASVESTTARSISTVGEVIVTARKKSENLQEVPLSVTALTSENLTAASVQDLRDVTLQTPGLTFNTGAGGNYSSTPIIRGQTDLGGGDNNVPVFFDGIYISNTAAIDFGLVDIARIEVIKGPESALYGRSAYAGAINYVSAPPSNALAGYAEITGGDDGKFNARANITGPLIDGILKGGVSGSYDAFQGTYHDAATNQNAGGYEKKDILANLDFTPNEHLEMRPVFYYGNDSFGAAPVIFAPANCSLGLGYGYSQSFCGHLPNNTFVGPYIAPSGQYGATGNTREVYYTNLEIKFNYDWGTITSLTGYDHIDSRVYAEFDRQDYGTPTATYYLPPGATVGTIPASGLGALPTGNTALTPLHFGYIDRNQDFSEELRYSSPDRLPVRVSIGGYYAWTRHFDDLDLARGTCAVPAGQYIIDPFATPCSVQTSPQFTEYTQTNKIYAGFGSLDWDIVKKLTLSTELRETAENSAYRDRYSIFTPNPYTCLGYSIACGTTPNPIGPETLSKTFWSLTSRSTLRYKFSDDMMVYVSAANGDKAGGFNNSLQYPTYNPETNWTYEIGVKSTWLDHRLQIDADIFYIDASNYQISGPPPGATMPGGFIVANFGGLLTPGFELASTLVVTDNIKLSGGVAVVNPRFKNNAFDYTDVVLCSGITSCAPRITTVGVNKAISLNNLRPPFESDVTFNAAIDLNYPLGGGWTWLAHMDYRYESSQYYQYPIDTGSYGPRNVVNLSTGWKKGPYSLTLYVRNLTNDMTPLTAQDAVAPGANNFQATYYPVAFLPDSRTFGATIRYRFGG